MNILLDTNAFLWAISDVPSLSKKAAREFLNEENALFLSVASLWEMIIKTGIGKLVLPNPHSDFLLEQLSINGISLLDIKPEHVFGVEKLPFYHGDPFDRLIISQGLSEKMPIVTGDKIFKRYTIRVIW